jgi:hypothetical protein
MTISIQNSSDGDWAYFVMEQSENLENLASIVSATANHSLSHLVSGISRYVLCYQMTYITATASCSKYRITIRRAVWVELDVEESFFLLSISQVFSIIILPKYVRF